MRAIDSAALAQQVVAEADRLGRRIAVAESLTGGLLAATIVSVPGASRVFSGGIVAYDTALKASLLAVDVGLLTAYGPVNPEVARQMARGARSACAVPPPGQAIGSTRSEADVAVATTGVAGPDADPQTGQAVGTVWIGVSSSAGEMAHELQLQGDRAEIRTEAVRAALQILRGSLRSQT